MGNHATLWTDLNAVGHQHTNISSKHIPFTFDYLSTVLCFWCCGPCSIGKLFSWSVDQVIRRFFFAVLYTKRSRSGVCSFESLSLFLLLRTLCGNLPAS